MGVGRKRLSEEVYKAGCLDYRIHGFPYGNIYAGDVLKPRKVCLEPKTLSNGGQKYGIRSGRGSLKLTKIF